MEENFNVWDVNNKTVTDVYRLNPNYKIEILDPNKKVCYIFFSSNGIYYPNTRKEFIKNIIERDRFEWEKIYRSPKLYRIIGKAIFVRDIYKQWYVTGINSEINSIDKIKSLLEKETKGYTVFTVGNSAGGYMATLIGILLNAKGVFSFSGQFSLADELESPFLKKYKEKVDYNKYYSLVCLIKKSTVPIYYFFPGKSNIDAKQAELVERIENVYAFKFNQRVHGETMFASTIPYILIKSHNVLERLYTNYQFKMINRYFFLFNIEGFWFGFMGCIRKLCGKIYRVICR